MVRVIVAANCGVTGRPSHGLANRHNIAKLLQLLLCEERHIGYTIPLGLFRLAQAQALCATTYQHRSRASSHGRPTGNNPRHRCHHFLSCSLSWGAQASRIVLSRCQFSFWFSASELRQGKRLFCHDKLHLTAVTFRLGRYFARCQRPS
jgi:hypothetical protein